MPTASKNPWIPASAGIACPGLDPGTRQRSAFWRFLHACRQAFFRAGSELVRLLPVRSKAPSVLIVRLDAIGDFLLWLSSGIGSVAAYGRSKGRTVLLANQDWADLARGLGIFDEVRPVDTRRFKRNPLYRFATLLRLRQMAFPLVIQARAGREYLLEDLLVRALRAADTTGNAGDTSNLGDELKRVSDAWYSRLIPVPPPSLPEPDRNRAFARALSGLEPQAVAINSEPDGARRFGVEGAYFVVAPAAACRERSWPVERFAEVALRLREARGWTCVVVGGGHDYLLGDSVRSAVGTACINLAGRTSLRELGDILGSAELAIVNESSAAHYAPLVGTKAVVVLGGGHFGRFLPYGQDWVEALRPVPVFKGMDCFGCNWQCRFNVPAGAPLPCIEQISVADVLKAVPSK